MDIAERSGRSARQGESRLSRRYAVIYDDQCEICQAFVAWLHLLDRRHHVDCFPIERALLRDLHPHLSLDACVGEMHVVTPDGDLQIGWDGVALLAKLFPISWPIGTLGSLPPFRQLGRRLYRWVATNRYALSKCRGGACRVARPNTAQKRAPLRAFWSCRMLGLVVRLPLILGAGAARLVTHVATYVRTYRRRIDLLGGRLTLLFLGGIFCDAVPILFGEKFLTILYDGVVVDPGSPRMRRSLARHLRGLPTGSIHGIAATHHHEEHVGNLSWAARRTGAPVFVTEATARLLQPPSRLPWVRAFVIGQPPPLEPPVEILRETLRTATGSLQVIPAPGHCDDQIVLYDPRERVLLAGDAFMGIHFATPNPDVDSRRWIETLERLLSLDIEVLVEGHGHIRTLRPDIPRIHGVVIREDPRAALESKLRFLRWLRQQVEAGMKEGLPPQAIGATCAPWGQGWAWENLLTDEAIRLFSLGHFSRAELVRSFLRAPAGKEILPTVYEAQFYRQLLPRPRPESSAGHP